MTLNNMDRKDFSKEIYSAGLLHDIGKFYQRSSGELDSNDSNLSDVARGLAHQICPKTQKGYFGYQHVLWTYQFFLDNNDVFNKVLSIENVNEPSQDNCTNFAIYHHRPHSKLQAIIQLADWWASGIDRSNSVEYANKDINWGKEKYKKVPLSSILQNVFVNYLRPEKGGKEYSFKLNPLSFSKYVVFPKDINNKTQTLQNDYKILWNQFVEEFKKLPTGSFDVFVESLYFLLKKYTWCIPASTQDYPDSSLFEHSKLVAAFADCLYRYHNNKPDDFVYDSDKFRIKVKNGCYPVILLCADISGIQNFIYNITSKRAAKSLKGRSFYLQILMETITNQLLEKTNTFRANVVYSSGGKMFLLLPNIKEVTDTIDSYRKELEKWVWDNFQGSIYVSIDYVPFAYDMDKRDETGKNILIEGKEGYFYLGDLWKEVVDRTALWKNKKFKSIIIEPDVKFFEPFGDGGETEVCAITGIESDKLKSLAKEDDEDAIKVLPIVEEQIEIGKNLVNHKYLIYSKEYLPKGVFNHCSYSFDILGSKWYIFNDTGYNNISSIDDAIIYKENHFDFLSNKKGNNSVYAFRFYGGNQVPTIKKDENGNLRIKTFQELVDKKAGFKRIAVLRMDVDNLGQLFTNGFKRFRFKGSNCFLEKDDSNFSKLATLSFLLDLFFSGYLNEIHKKYIDNVMVIYSGGDDVFAIGDWQAIIDFANDIRNEFREFACKREDLSLSAGIALVNEKFPISKAADLAGEAEDNAKRFGEIKIKVCNSSDNSENASIVEKSIKKKNAVNIFEQNISWEREFEATRDIMNFLYNALKEQKISKGLLQKFFVFWQMKKNKQLNWYWHSAYTLARHKKNDNETIIETLKTLLTTGIFIKGNEIKYKLYNRNLDILATASRWAELKLRSEK